MESQLNDNVHETKKKTRAEENVRDKEESTEGFPENRVLLRFIHSPPFAKGRY